MHIHLLYFILFLKFFYYILTSECLLHNQSTSEKGKQNPMQLNESLNIAILFLN